MSYWVTTQIKELRLSIPFKDFPLKSDLIVGFNNPEMVYPCDEGSKDILMGTMLKPEIGGEVMIEFFWPRPGVADCSLTFYECDNSAIEELEKLCEKYKGTLIADMSGEDGAVDPSDFIRIRKGVRKKIKIVEE